MNPRHLFELVTYLTLAALCGCATAQDADLSAQGETAQGGGTAGGAGSDTNTTVGGATTGGGAPDATSGASTGGTPDQGDGGSNASGGAGDAASGGVSARAGASAGGTPAGGAAAGGAPAGGAAAGGAPATGLGPWNFDAGVQGWAVRDHSATITTMPTASAGVVAFTAVPFSAASQYTDFALSFSPTADLTGHTLHAKVRRVSGGFIGAQLYAYGGAWVGSAFTSLTSATFVDLALPVTASSGFDPSKITRIGLKFNTGATTTNKFSNTTLELDSVTIQ